MKVEYQTVEPVIVITLAKSEARELKSLVGLGNIHFVPQVQNVAEATSALRSALWNALKAKGL